MENQVVTTPSTLCFQRRIAASSSLGFNPSKHKLELFFFFQKNHLCYFKEYKLHVYDVRHREPFTKIPNCNDLTAALP